MPRLRRKNRSAISGFNNEEDRDPSECSTTDPSVQKKEKPRAPAKHCGHTSAWLGDRNSRF